VAGEVDIDPDVGNILHGLDRNLRRVFLPFILRNIRHVRSYTRLARGFREADIVRRGHISDGTRVPPFMILSVTGDCNLSCDGCYAEATGITSHSGKGRVELDSAGWERVISDIASTGVFAFVIAGGEPFLVPGLLDMIGEHQDRLFIILTNGTVMDDESVKRLKRLRNAVVIVSFEGDRALTDGRRGGGVFDRAWGTLNDLSRAGVLTGVSATITRENYSFWMSGDLLRLLDERGQRLLFLLEYIPTTPCSQSSEDSDHSLMLTPSERRSFRSWVGRVREEAPIYFVHSPGDEDFFGGCVSAGRGFAHVTPSGDLTPCPVSNIATHNLVETPFLEALRTPLFSRIREEEHLLETDGMPCALFAHPEEVDELAKDVGAYRTG